MVNGSDGALFFFLSSLLLLSLTAFFELRFGGVNVTREGGKVKETEKEKKGDIVRERNTLLSMVHDIIMPGAAD
jgi:hypothetical protein